MKSNREGIPFPGQTDKEKVVLCAELNNIANFQYGQYGLFKLKHIGQHMEYVSKNIGIIH